MADMKVVSIGAGNIATHLIPALHESGCDILQVYSRDLGNARKLSTRVASTPINDLKNITPTADIYLIMIHDDGIRSLVRALPKLNPKAILAHTSGATPTLPLAIGAEHYGSFYPWQSFSKGKPTDLTKVPFLVFGNTPFASRNLRMMARQLSPTVKEVDDKGRLHYHLAAVLMNNFTNHLACKTATLLSSNDMDPDILKPIVRSSFDRILDMDPCQIQTGPAVRGDNKVEQLHLDLINEDPYLSAIYKAMSQSIKKINKDLHANNG